MAKLKNLSVDQLLQASILSMAKIGLTSIVLKNLKMYRGRFLLTCR